MVQTISLQTNKGFTLIEVMIAFFILGVSLLGLLQSVNLAIQHNLQNQIREEAVQLASTEMHKMRTSAFDDDFTNTTTFPTTIASKIRSGALNYTIARTRTVLSTGSYQYQVNVQWQLKGQTFTHSTVTVRSNRQ